MKTVSIIIGSILLLFNVLVGLMLSSYSTFNCALNSGIIIVSVVMLCVVSSMKLSDGFRVSFNCLFPVFTLIELVCGFLAPERFNDNLYLIAIILLVVMQVVMLVSAGYLSTKNNFKNGSIRRN